MTEQGDMVRLHGIDGLDLVVRDWNAGPGADVVLCLHGLTRNGRDFTALAEHLGGRFRLIAPDQRGRGRSAYADPATYTLPIQIQDTLGLLDQMGISRCVVIGTSMGALMAVAMAAMAPDRIAGVVLNDAGPAIDPAGLARIAGYVGQADPVGTWEAARRRLQTLHGAAYPTYTDTDWDRLARWTFVEGETGLTLDYDPRLREAVSSNVGAVADLWPMFEVLNRTPSLMLRGDRSDILSQATAEEVARRFGTRLVTVPDRGHAPDLSEPEALKSILAFLADPIVRTRLDAARSEVTASA